jgi:uncharacterized alpha-E superfamily protein
MMLSRVADSLYWMSRYLERAEHTARLMEVQLNLLLDRSPVSADRRWRHTLSLLEHDHEGEEVLDGRAVIHMLAFDGSDPSSIVSSIMSARENARQVREQISSEMWEQVNRLFHEVRRADLKAMADSSPHEFLVAIREGVHLFKGMTNSTMTHGEGYEFIPLGRYLERARSLCILIGAHFREFPLPPDGEIGTGEHLEWVGLLRCCTAFEAFCKAYTADPLPARVAEFLVLDPRFPHSIRYSVNRAETSLRTIHEMSGGRRRSEANRLAGRLRAAVEFAEIGEILAAGIQEFLDGIQKQNAAVHEALYLTYIDYPIEAALAS